MSTKQFVVLAEVEDEWFEEGRFPSLEAAREFLKPIVAEMQLVGGVWHGNSYSVGVYQELADGKRALVKE